MKVITIQAGAQNTSPSATPTNATKLKQLEDLKERLATKVAELRQTERRAAFGAIKTITISTFTIEMPTKDIKIELTDDIKVVQYVKGKRTKLAVSDLAVGDLVVVFGDFDTTLDLLKGKVIFIQNPVDSDLINLSATITDVDEGNFTLTVNSHAGPNYTIDIEKTTKTQLWTKERGIAKGGFSKLLVDDTVHIVGTPVHKKENRISALRILDLGNLTGAKAPISPSVSPEQSPSPTKKPTIRATPKPTPTPSPAA